MVTAPSSCAWPAGAGGTECGATARSAARPSRGHPRAGSGRIRAGAPPTPRATRRPGVRRARLVGTRRPPPTGRTPGSRVAEPGFQPDQSLPIEAGDDPGEALHAVGALEWASVFPEIGLRKASAVPHPGAEEAVEPRADEGVHVAHPRPSSRIWGEGHASNAIESMSTSAPPRPRSPGVGRLLHPGHGRPVRNVRCRALPAAIGRWLPGPAGEGRRPRANRSRPTQGGRARSRASTAREADQPAPQIGGREAPRQQHDERRPVVPASTSASSPSGIAARRFSVHVIRPPSRSRPTPGPRGRPP